MFLMSFWIPSQPILRCCSRRFFEPLRPYTPPIPIEPQDTHPPLYPQNDRELICVVPIPPMPPQRCFLLDMNWKCTPSPHKSHEVWNWAPGRGASGPCDPVGSGPKWVLGPSRPSFAWVREPSADQAHSVLKNDVQ